MNYQLSIISNTARRSIQLYLKPIPFPSINFATFSTKFVTFHLTFANMCLIETGLNCNSNVDKGNIPVF